MPAVVKIRQIEVIAPQKTSEPFYTREAKTILSYNGFGMAAGIFTAMLAKSLNYTPEAIEELTKLGILSALCAAAIGCHLFNASKLTTPLFAAFAIGSIAVQHKMVDLVLGNTNNNNCRSR